MDLHVMPHDLHGSACCAAGFAWICMSCCRIFINLHAALQDPGNSATKHGNQVQAGGGASPILAVGWCAHTCLQWTRMALSLNWYDVSLYNCLRCSAHIPLGTSHHSILDM